MFFQLWTFFYSFDTEIVQATVMDIDEFVREVIQSKPKPFINWTSTFRRTIKTISIDVYINRLRPNSTSF